MIWTSRDGVTWQRLTAAQLGLQESGGLPRGIDFATSQGNATVIADRGAGVWLSTDSGAHWSPVTVPVDHGAQNSVSGVSFDRSGLVLVRPGTAASGAGNGVTYFSADGRTWRYAGTIDAAGGWSPDAVKGSDYGFVVTGHTKGQYVAYTATGTGARWLPTGPLGDTSSGPDFNPAVGPGGSVIAAGNTNSTRTGQEGRPIGGHRGNLEPVSLSAIPGGLVPEETVTSTAVSGRVQIAVGSANGYPAVWRRVSGGPWSLVSSLARVSADPDLGGLSTVTYGPHGWLAARPGGFALTSADGATWQPSGTLTHDLAGVTAVQAASGPRGYVIVGTASGPGGAHERDVWWSPDLSGWTRSGDVERDQRLRPGAGRRGGLGGIRVGGLARRPAGHVDLLRRPDLDGRHRAAAVRGVGRGAPAGGGQREARRRAGPAGHRERRPASRRAVRRRRPDLAAGAVRAPGPGTSFTALTAGAGGFTAAAQFGSAGPADAAVWTSADGTKWTRSQISGLVGGGSHAIAALSASGAAVTGIDSVQSQAGQQFAVLNLPAG